MMGREGVLIQNREMYEKFIVIQMRVILADITSSFSGEFNMVYIVLPRYIIYV